MAPDALAPAAVVVTQVAVADALAAACALQRLPVVAVPTPVGCLAACLGTGPDAGADVARAVSSLLAGTTVLLLEQRDGRITATRWTGGAPAGTVAPGLALDGAPAVIERLLLGQARAADQPGAVSSEGMGRWRATRTLAAVTRATRRAARPERRPPG